MAAGHNLQELSTKLISQTSYRDSCRSPPEPMRVSTDTGDDWSIPVQEAVMLITKSLTERLRPSTGSGREKRPISHPGSHRASPARRACREG
ncbi:Hypothetical predicted protein [Pelobates cultripes]|uniref:Uncharacterized protein n=1 Tax=Pelobates cultripes TaxID=61616 RepID=A0AAD1RFS2_PELCU|nr:Hypothetical predicted protein [Pelobates cultripes]